MKAQNMKMLFSLGLSLSLAIVFYSQNTFARHEDSAGVYKAQAYQERAVRTLDSVVTSSTKESQALQASPAKVSSLQSQAPASVTAKVISQVKNFFFGNEKPASIQAKPVAVTQPPAAATAQNLKRNPSSDNSSVWTAPSAPLVQVQAPMKTHDVVKNLASNKAGVETYEISSSKIPYLEINKEVKISAQSYALSDSFQKKFSDFAVAPLSTPETLTDKEVQGLTKISAALPNSQFAKMTPAHFTPISHAELDKLKWLSGIESPLKLVKYLPLTTEETRLLNGILLFKQGDRCAVAVSLFHPLTKTPFYESEGNYYLSMCSKQLGLMTDFYEKARRVFEAEDLHYSKKLFKELSQDVPPEVIDGLGKALFKLSSNKKAFEDVDPIVKGNVYYILANFGAKTERFKTTLSYAQLVPEKHPKYLEAQFLRALAEYEIGDRSKALQIQEGLIKQLSLEKKNEEFQALVALNLARMQFQEKKFKEARENFLKVSKDHPLWVQSLTEMGWSQLEMSDFSGAIGNMYSVQSPFFNAVYKPESYVIRTIGYLNLCQYGDAYKTLSVLEKMYRPYFDKMVAYQTSGGHAVYQTVKTYITSKTSSETDGLPGPIIREMARHKDFLVRQLALNRQAEERDIYARLDKDVETSLARAQATITKSRTRIEVVKKQLIAIGNIAAQAELKHDLESELEREFKNLNSQFFQIDLFNDAKKAVSAYRAESVKLAEERIASSKTDLEITLKKRLTNMKEDLIRILDNNELLRYEVYSGSGENIRFQVAGGEKSNRVPASVMPKSKSLQWDFDGEYWEDEIGHYRSSLKNNCPDSKQARNGGDQ